MENSIAALVWLIVIQGVILLGAVVVIALFLKSLVERLTSLFDTLNTKVLEIDGELKPILRNLEQCLRSAEPFARELGDRRNEIGAMLENLERLSEDAQATTSAIRYGIVPIAHSLAGIFSGLVEGARVLGESARRHDRDVQ
jgi:methyl-accepting chemotaxis protein